MRIIYLLLAVSISALLIGCAGGGEGEAPESGISSTAQFRTITASEAREVMGGGDVYILLDVRSREEFSESHIEGALLIPVDELEALAAEFLPDKDKIILIYCRSGRRSADAAGMLADMGYTAVFDFGGIIDWHYGTIYGIGEEPAQLSATAQNELAVESVPEPVAVYPFVVPIVEHPYAGEMLALVTGFSAELIFPEFESLEEMDFADGRVSTNLYLLAPWQGDATYPGGVRVRRQDMTEVGRRFFGEDFYFPAGVVGLDIEPADVDSEYYQWFRGRGGASPNYYVATQVFEEEEGLFSASFLVFWLGIDFDDTEVHFVNGVSFHNPNFLEDGIRYDAVFEEPIVIYIRDFVSYTEGFPARLEDLRLPVPQDELPVLTVTFRREESGNLIAISSRYHTVS